MNLSKMRPVNNNNIESVRKTAAGRKADFPLLSKNLAYLDNAATTQKPKVVISSLVDFYENYNANVHRGIYTLSEKATMEYESAREIVARFINCSSEEIIYTKGTTEGLNFLAAALGKQLQQGDEIIISIMEHHANLIPWQILAKEKGLKLSFIPIKEGELDLKQARKLINKKTKIVSLTHISNVLGTINPIEEITKMAHAVGAAMIIDAAQSIAHLPIDVKELDCDYLAFSGHKAYGPTGIGVLYGKKALLEKLEPFQYGGDMIKNVTKEKSEWNDLPWKFEAGTPPIAEAIALGEAFRYLQEVGWEEIRKREEELLKYAEQELKKISAVQLIMPRKNKSGIISFTLNGVHPHDVAEILSQNKVCIRSGQHCAMPLMQELGLNGTNRASFSFYNDKNDVDMLITGIRKALEVLK